MDSQEYINMRLKIMREVDALYPPKQEPEKPAILQRRDNIENERQAKLLAEIRDRPQEQNAISAVEAMIPKIRKLEGPARAAFDKIAPFEEFFPRLSLKFKISDLRGLLGCGNIALAEGRIREWREMTFAQIESHIMPSVVDFSVVIELRKGLHSALNAVRPLEREYALAPQLCEAALTEVERLLGKEVAPMVAFDNAPVVADTPATKEARESEADRIRAEIADDEQLRRRQRLARQW